KAPASDDYASLEAGECARCALSPARQPPPRYDGIESPTAQAPADRRAVQGSAAEAAGPNGGEVDLKLVPRTLTGRVRRATRFSRPERSPVIARPDGPRQQAHG